MTVRKLIGGFAAAMVLAISTSAVAHHGWSWAEDEQIEMTGIIRSISFAPPHPSLGAEIEGKVWNVELGNPNQTQRAGFVEGKAEIGDEVVILGHRSLDQSELVIKAVRITIDGQNYDLYPQLIESR